MSSLTHAVRRKKLRSMERDASRNAKLAAEVDALLVRHRGGRRIRQAPTGRLVFAAHERDHHITTAGRRALTRDQFALPPGPAERRRGILGRLPIDTRARARNALQRASAMRRLEHLTAKELDLVRRSVRRTWPTIKIRAA